MLHSAGKDNWNYTIIKEMEKINYAYAYGHLDGAMNGYRLMKEMKEKGLELNDLDLQFTIQNLLDDAINNIKKEVHKEAHKVYEAHGM